MNSDETRLPAAATGARSALSQLASSAVAAPSRRRARREPAGPEAKSRPSPTAARTARSVKAACCRSRRVMRGVFYSDQPLAGVTSSLTRSVSCIRHETATREPCILVVSAATGSVRCLPGFCPVRSAGPPLESRRDIREPLEGVRLSRAFGPVASAHCRGTVAPGHLAGAQLMPSRSPGCAVDGRGTRSGPGNAPRRCGHHRLAATCDTTALHGRCGADSGRRPAPDASGHQRTVHSRVGARGF